MNRHLRIWTPVLVTWIVFMVIRDQWIAPEEIGRLCEARSAPWWCRPRDWLINFGGLGYFALAFGLLGMFSRHCGIAVAAACLSVAAIVLYDYEFGTVGLALSVMTLARLTLRPQAPVGH